MELEFCSWSAADGYRHGSNPYRAFRCSSICWIAATRSSQFGMEAVRVMPTRIPSLRRRPLERQIELLPRGHPDF